MKLTWSQDDNEKTIQFSGEIDMREVAKLNLDSFDRALMYIETDKASDFLLIAEMLFRRAEEQQRRATVESL